MINFNSFLNNEHHQRKHSQFHISIHITKHIDQLLYFRLMTFGCRYPNWRRISVYILYSMDSYFDEIIITIQSKFQLNNEWNVGTIEKILSITWSHCWLLFLLVNGYRNMLAITQCMHLSKVYVLKTFIYNFIEKIDDFFKLFPI